MQAIRRVGIIGDVHGEDRALATVLRFLLGLPGLDALLCTGDVLAKRSVGDTERCCQLLAEHGVMTVRGNHDRWFQESDGDPLMVELGMDHPEIGPAARAFLRNLPTTRSFTTPRGPLLLCHGIGEDDNARVFPGGDDAEVAAHVLREPAVAAGNYRFLVGGHTHVLMYRPLPNNAPILLNAGTLHWGYECGFLVAEFDTGMIRFFHLDHDANYAITPGPAYCLPLEAAPVSSTDAPGPVLRRIGLLGDIHAEDELLARSLERLQREGVDAILCTGDIVTGIGDAGACLKRLQAAGVLCVRGNHDRWFLTTGERYADMPNATAQEEVGEEEHRFLASFPPTRTVDTLLGRLLLCHGTGTDDMAGIYPGDSDTALSANHQLHRLYAEGEYRFLVAGHTHQRMRKSLDHLTVINPGTLLHTQVPGFMLADFDQKTLEVFKFDMLWEARPVVSPLERDDQS